MTQLLENALMGTILILVTAALRRALRNRLPAGTWLTLWGVCLFRLLTPVSPDSIWSVYRLPRLLAGTGRTGAPSMTDPAQFVLSVEAAEQSVAEAPAGSAMPSLSTVLWGIYLLSAAVLALYFLWVWLSTWRAVGRTILLDRDDPRYAALPRFARLREGPMDGAPLTFGAVRPTVVLFPGLSGAELDCALAHEAVHARRRDNLWHYAMAAALVVHWWNPAVWLMYRLLRRDVELACDRAALARLGGDHRAEYANAIISMSTQAEGPAFCHRFGQKQAEERIIAVMKYKKTTIVGLALALVLVCGVTAAFAASAPQETAEPTAYTEDKNVDVKDLPKSTTAGILNDANSSEGQDISAATEADGIVPGAETAAQLAEPGPDATVAEQIDYLAALLSQRDVDIHVVTPELAYEYAYAIELLKQNMAEKHPFTQEQADAIIAAAEYTLEDICAKTLSRFCPMIL